MSISQVSEVGWSHVSLRIRRRLKSSAGSGARFERAGLSRRGLLGQV